MIDELEFKELSDYVDKIEDAQVNESIRQDNTTSVLQDLVEIMKKMTTDPIIIGELESVYSDIMKGC